MCVLDKKSTIPGKYLENWPMAKLSDVIILFISRRDRKNDIKHSYADGGIHT